MQTAVDTHREEKLKLQEQVSSLQSELGNARDETQSKEKRINEVQLHTCTGTVTRLLVQLHVYS